MNVDIAKINPQENYGGAHSAELVNGLRLTGKHGSQIRPLGPEIVGKFQERISPGNKNKKITMSSKEFATTSEHTRNANEPVYLSEYQERRASFSKLMRDIMKE